MSDTYRVLCSDGNVAEQLDGPDAERWARLAAANADDMHDGARCTEPHRIVRATWSEVPRRCEHYTRHVRGCPGCRTRADEIHAHYELTGSTGSGD